MAGYSGTPLVKKLGIKPGSTVVVLGAPRGFTRLLVDLPRDVRLETRAAGTPDLALWFVTSRRDVEHRIAAIGELLDAGLWIVWPKKASGVKTDLTEDVVRSIGLAHGWVDHKVCAVDETWSGLRFAKRQN